MSKRYIVRLTDDERRLLHDLITSGRAANLELTHARILLKADCAEGSGATDRQIREALNVSLRTIARVRRYYFSSGLQSALTRRVHAARLDPIAKHQAEEGPLRFVDS